MRIQVYYFKNANVLIQLKEKNQTKSRYLLSPASDAVVAVVAQSAVVRSPPGDCGPGSTTHFTPESNAVANLTCYIADRDEELWRSCRERTKVKDDKRQSNQIKTYFYTLNVTSNSS